MSAAIGLAPSSCAHDKLLPAESAHAIPDAPETAVDQVAGVRISADGDDWSAAPADLPERLTPIKVRIVNHSGAPIEILYQRFSLAGGHGRVYQPLPLVPIEHRRLLAGGGPLHPIYSSSSFYVGPLFEDVYPSLVSWPKPLPRDTAFYDRQYRRWGKDLPTLSMRRMGLPEGVLADGGEISGFLYFENATRHDRRLTFRTGVDDVRHDNELAEIEIPFRVQ